MKKNDVQPSVTDPVESISSPGSRRKRHRVGLFPLGFLILSCLSPIKAKSGGRPVTSFTGMKAVNAR